MLICKSALAAPTVIIVTGAEGQAEYGREFTEWADRWEKAAQIAGAEVIQIGQDGAPATQPSTAPTTAPLTDKALLQSILANQSSEKTNPLWLVLIGHGTSDGREHKFNLRGPDFTDKELVEWVKLIERPLAVINCSSSSAPFLNSLSSKGRVIITATRSGSELQFSRFGNYLSSAIVDPSADLDKDGQVSLLEAFLAASHRTQEFYRQAGRLATEHALLDDNGDSRGISADFFQGFRATHSARDSAPLDGPLAHQWHLLLSPQEQSIPAELRARRDALELEIEQLRQKKAVMSELDYYAQLEPLLLKLARLYQQIDETTN